MSIYLEELFDFDGIDGESHQLNSWIPVAVYTAPVSSNNHKDL